MNEMKPLALLSNLVLVAIALALSTSAAHAQTYRVTDLGTINTDPQTGVVSSHPTGINNAGQVAGYSYSGTSNHAARFTNGLVEDLGHHPRRSTRAPGGESTISGRSSAIHNIPSMAAPFAMPLFLATGQ